MSDDTTDSSIGVNDATTTMTTHTITTAATATSIVPTKPQNSPMEIADVLRLVVSFLPKHYRFIAVICKGFHAAYMNEFPKDTETNFNASTAEYAKIYWEELKPPSKWAQFVLSSLAAKNGSEPAMQYFRSVGCKWNERTCAKAAENGHLNTLQYARENGCPWNKYTCARAALNGHLEILQYARENNCPWDKWTCENAAYNGHLNVLQWARENGCPWDADTCAYAAGNGHLNIIKYAQENGCPWDADAGNMDLHLYH